MYHDTHQNILDVFLGRRLGYRRVAGKESSELARTRKRNFGGPVWLQVIVAFVIVLTLMPWVLLVALAAAGVWLQRNGYVVLDPSVVRKPWRGHESRWVTAGSFALVLIGIAVWGVAAGLSILWPISVAVVAGVLFANSEDFSWPQWLQPHVDALDGLKERLLLQIRAMGGPTERTSYTSYSSRDDSGMQSIDAMDGWSFETRMRQHFEAMGWRVMKTPGSGDHGADLVLTTPDGRRIVAQLKRYTGPVGINAVKEVLHSMAHYRANAAMVITNSHLSVGARHYAREHQVDVWEREELIQRLQDEHLERSYQQRFGNTPPGYGPWQDPTN